MRRHLVRNLSFLLVALALIATSLIAAHLIVRAQSDQAVALRGQTVPLIQKARLLQATNSAQQVQISVALNWRNQGELDNLLSAIYNPHSPLYHHYLTSAAFDQEFAPTPEQVQQVASFLRGHGLSITRVASNRMLIEARGSVAQIEQTFHVQINNYQLGPRVFYANANPPSVPASLSSLISSISGLDNSVQYHPLGLTRLQRSQAGPSGYGPQELSGAYDAASLKSANILGDNQTVAVFELDGYQQSDLDQYFQQYNLGKPNIQPVLVDGADGSANDGAIEVELDIEVIAAMAPHANQLVYEGPNSTAGLNATYNQIVSDDKASVVSISWGLCEASTGTSELDTLDNIFKAGAAKGITFYAASGDSGAYDCNDTSLAVDSPADDPYVTGVGGTNLQLNNGAYGSESVWSDPSDTQRSPEGSGGGGGFSSHFQQPSWQSGPGTGSGNNGMREVPDVSADADPATGYAVYCTVSASGCSSSGWITVGGTSAAAPLWAGSTALINQYLQSQNKSPVGHITPALYSLFSAQQSASAFHDITQGDNLHYQATQGYDMASGIGSPDISNLARALAGNSGVGGPTPTPPTGSPTPSPTATPAPPTSLLKNGGFENGRTPWQQSSSGSYQLIDSLNPHSGSYSAYLCGYAGCNDRIWQSVTLPNGFTKITISYWLYTTSSKSTKQCLDTFSARLQSGSGATIHILQRTCNADASNRWQQQRFDVTGALAHYTGGPIVLLFQGTTAPGIFASSDFFVDDVTVTIE